MNIRSYFFVGAIGLVLVVQASKEWDSGPFFKAVKKLDLDAVKKAADHAQFKVNVQNEYGLTVLDYLVIVGTATKDRLVTTEEEKKNFKNDKKYQQLIQNKINNEDVEKAAPLLDFIFSKKPDTTKVDDKGNSYLMYLTFCYGECGGINNTLIEKFIAYERGKKDQKLSIVDMKNKGGYTPLLFAASEARNISLCLHNQNIRIKMTQVEIARYENQLRLYGKLFRTLVYKAQADLNVQTNKGWNLLHFLCSIPEETNFVRILMRDKGVTGLLSLETDKKKVPGKFLDASSLDLLANNLIGSSPSDLKQNDRERIFRCFKAFLLGNFKKPSEISQKMYQKALNLFKIQGPDFKKLGQ